MEGVRKGSDGKWEGRGGRGRGGEGGREGNEGVHLTHFAFRTLAALLTSDQSPLLDLILHFPAIRQMVL